MYTIVKCNGNNYSINAIQKVIKRQEIQEYFFWLPPSTTFRVMNLGPEWEGGPFAARHSTYKDNVQIQYVLLVGA